MAPELHVNAPLLAPLAAHELLTVCILWSSKHLFCQRLPVLTKAQKYWSSHLYSSTQHASWHVPMMLLFTSPSSHAHHDANMHRCTVAANEQRTQGSVLCGTVVHSSVARHAKGLCCACSGSPLITLMYMWMAVIYCIIKYLYHVICHIHTHTHTHARARTHTRTLGLQGISIFSNIEVSFFKGICKEI